MTLQSHPQRVLELARTQGLLRTADLDALGAPRIVLSRLVARGHLERVGRGLYRLTESDALESPDLVSVAIKAPQAVFCLITALQFHELTTQLPRQVWIAMPRGSHAPRIQHPPIHMVQFTGASYSEGIEIFVRDQVPLRVYNIAKTVADCFKQRHKIGLDVALEALKDAMADRKVSIDDLWHYAKICRVSNVMRPYLEAIA